MHIRSCGSALQIWRKLQNLYEDRGLQRKTTLLRTLISYRLDDCDGMQVYIDGIMNTASKLQSVGFNLTDDWISAIMLAGLTEKFEPLIMTLEASKEAIKVDELKHKLLDAQPDASGKGEAFLSKNNGRKGKQKFSKKKKTRRCYICNSPAHIANKCDQKASVAEEKSKKRNLMR